MKPTPRPGSQAREAGDLGRWIRHARRNQALSTQAAADLCGVSRRFLSEVERGKPTAQVGKVLHVLTQLGLTVSVRPRGEAP